LKRTCSSWEFKSQRRIWSSSGVRIKDITKDEEDIGGESD
jgi:hypothetical protein